MPNLWDSEEATTRARRVSLEAFRHGLRSVKGVPRLLGSSERMRERERERERHSASLGYLLRRTSYSIGLCNRPTHSSVMVSRTE